MTFNIHAVALWIGLVGGVIGIYVPIHSELNQQRDEVKQQREDAIKEALQRQQVLNAINARFANDESAIAAVASQLPQDKRDILNAIQNAEIKAQIQVQMQTQGEMFQKFKSVKPGKSGASTDAPVAADAPATKKPE